jgi:hypothetical protein
MFFYSNDAAFFTYDVGVAGFDDYFVASGLSGVGATWFLKPRTPSAYVDGTIGIAAWNEISTDGGTVDGITGVGLSVGGGLEFARHWLVDGEVVVGRPRGDFDGVSTMTVRVGLIWLCTEADSGEWPGRHGLQLGVGGRRHCSVERTDLVVGWRTLSARTSSSSPAGRVHCRAAGHNRSLAKRDRALREHCARRYRARRPGEATAKSPASRSEGGTRSLCPQTETASS